MRTQLGLFVDFETPLPGDPPSPEAIRRQQKHEEALERDQRAVARLDALAPSCPRCGVNVLDVDRLECARCGLPAVVVGRRTVWRWRTGEVA